MKTFVMWTHYECEVGVYLCASRELCYHALKSDWLNDCNEDDCGHETLDTIEEIADALSYHYEEMSYDINEVEVPVLAQDLPESVETPPDPPASFSVSAEQTGDLLNALQSFKGQ